MLAKSLERRDNEAEETVVVRQGLECNTVIVVDEVLRHLSSVIIGRGARLELCAGG